MAAPTARHETRALLRAHLAAASGYRHLTHHCPVCHRLLRLTMESLTAPQAPYGARESGSAPRRPGAPQKATGAGAAPGPGRTAAGEPAGDESPPTT
ncbi:DUF6274 family protein [Streptomyces sp. NRRL WC-3549]|uniref:DUF6274 family protein n=1 Tax=Streptomyces sp. NRRL WC-3549 TaxID=1463925 RepID=UPI0004C63C52|nr:DUF6274 family protein [Streptomyces sp. NRRL WC-3549]